MPDTKWIDRLEAEANMHPRWSSEPVKVSAALAREIAERLDAAEAENARLRSEIEEIIQRHENPEDDPEWSEHPHDVLISARWLLARLNATLDGEDRDD